jgi:cbb3-type cytochrome oxidase maturation protein
MNYSSGWLALVIISLAASLVAFIWGLASGQFSDQARARYLPLCDDVPVEPAAGSAKPAPAMYVYLGIMVMGLCVFMVPILLTLLE